MVAEVLSIIPFGTTVLLVVKGFLILPNNRVSKWVYDKVANVGARVINKESTIGGVVKTVSVFLCACSLTVTSFVINLAGIED